MPSGDAQRTWFPEMIVRLRAEWHAGMSMPALITNHFVICCVLRLAHHPQTEAELFQWMPLYERPGLFAHSSR